MLLTASHDEFETRKRIRDLRENPELSDEQRTKEIQRLFQNRCKQACLTHCTPQVDMKSNYAMECIHYKKKCSKFRFECCGTVDCCHRCHFARVPECTKTRPPMVSLITCNECSFEQKPSNICENCGIKFADNYCSECKIWTPLNITHCSDCGFCRVGKPEEIFHCHTCSACFCSETRDNHRCSKVPLTDMCCALCMESMHTSQKPSSILSCGHALHLECWKQNAQKGNYRCPTCRKSVFDMSQAWARIRNSIELQPIPPGMFPIHIGDTVESPCGKFLVTAQRKTTEAGAVMYEGVLSQWVMANGKSTKAVFHADSLIKYKMSTILCCDCEKRSVVKFHFLGLECQHCGSFNTNQV